MGQFKFPNIEEPSLRVKARRYFTSIFCFFFTFFGFGVITCTAILVSRRPTECAFLSEFFMGVYLLLCAGCVTGFFSLLTCVHMQRSKSSRIFVPICNVVIVVLMMQISAAIAGHIMYTSASTGELMSLLNSTWHDYYLTDEAKDCVDHLQAKFECCGLSSDAEWLSLSVNASLSLYPSSCLCSSVSDVCTVRSDSSNNGSHLVYVHNISCHNVVLDYLFDTLLIPRVLGPVLSLAEFVLVLAAIYIFHHIDNRSMVGAYVVGSPPTEDAVAPTGPAQTELQSEERLARVCRTTECGNTQSDTRDETVMHI